MGPKRSDAERGEVAATASLGALKFRKAASWAWDFFLKFGVLDWRIYWKIRIEEHLLHPLTCGFAVQDMINKKWDNLIYTSVLALLVTPWPHALLRGNDNAWIELNIQLLQVGTCSLGLHKCKGTFFFPQAYSTRKLSSCLDTMNDTSIFFHHQNDIRPLFPPGDGARTPRNAFGSWYLWWWRFPRGASRVEDGSWGSHIEDG